MLYQLRRLRQSMYDLRRQSGIDEEIRNVERTVREATWKAEARAAKVIEREESLGKEESPDAQEDAPDEAQGDSEEPPETEEPKAPDS
jgi:hypothetical protein